MHDSRSIANRFIEIAGERGNTLTPMQLLKLVYIAHGWMLGLYGVPLIRNHIQAWKFGPVIPDLYHAVKRYKDGPVVEKILVPDEQLVAAEKDLIQQVYDIYGDISGVGLSNLTHQKGTPWHRVYIDGVSRIPIPNDIIQEHYHALSQA